MPPNHTALHELLLQLFSTGELRVFLCNLPDVGNILAALPGEDASLEKVLTVAVPYLQRRNLIDGEFFDRLVVERPRWKDSIRRLAHLFQVEVDQGGPSVAADEQGGASEALAPEVRRHLDALLGGSGPVGPRDTLAESYLPRHVDGPASRRRGAVRLPLTELLRDQSRLLIVGPSGAGKTYLFRRLAKAWALDLTEYPRVGTPRRAELLGMDSDKPVRIPALLNLSQLAALLAAAGADPDLDDRWRLLDALIQSGGPTGPPEQNDPEHRARLARWGVRLEAGEVMLLLDGLDEVPEEICGRVLTILQDAHERWNRCPIIVASRPGPLDPLRAMGFKEALLAPLKPAEVATFVRRRDEGHSKASAGRLSATLVERHAVQGLAQSPGALARLCEAYEHQRGLSAACREIFMTMLDSRQAQRSAAGFSRRFAEAALARLALAMLMRADGSPQTIGWGAAADAIDAVVEDYFGRLPCPARRDLALQWLRSECQWSELVVETARGGLRFWHPLVQNVAAALELARRESEESDRVSGWWPIVRDRLGDPEWVETVDMFPSCLYDRTSHTRVHDLFERLFALGEHETPAGRARVLGHIERFLESLRTHDGYEPPERLRARVTALQGRVRPLLTVRAAVQEAYFRARHPWRRAGEVLELPGRYVLLGKFPVTVEEFASFVAAGEYTDDAYWDEEGRRLRDREGWTAPERWDHQRKHPKRPVSGVSWHEARAYCAWLSRKLDMRVRLPRVEEWEYAASPEGRAYPWGDDAPTDDRGNFKGQVGEPTPVGEYPRGVGPFGHLDLLGNVWEWCEDSQPDADTGRRDWGKKHILKGGGWNASPLTVHVRLPGWSRRRYDYRGFRIIVELDHDT